MSKFLVNYEDLGFTDGYFLRGLNEKSSEKDQWLWRGPMSDIDYFCENISEWLEQECGEKGFDWLYIEPNLNDINGFCFQRKNDAKKFISFWRGDFVKINRPHFSGWWGGEVDSWLEKNCGIKNLDWLDNGYTRWIRDKEKAALFKLFWG